MSRLILLVSLVAVILLTAVCGEKQESRQAGPNLDDWQASVRADHPRLFVNSDTWPMVKEYALSEEAALVDSLRGEIDAIIDSLGPEGTPDVADHGRDAAISAFLFMLFEEDEYLNLAHRMLERSLEYYHQCYEREEAVSWYSFSRINAWAAYDWIFNHISEEDRVRLGESFLRAVAQVQPTDERESFPQENWLGPISGFYGTPGLLWYAGLAVHGEGINDSLATAWMQRGYDLYTELLKYRSGNAGDDGGSASGALNYTLTSYPWAEFNFFHTFISATGIDIAARWPYVALLPGYIHWNWLPRMRDFGWGDSYHWTNEIRTHSLHMHLSQILHFYAESMPRESAFAMWMRDRIERDDRLSFIFHRFLVTNRPTGVEAAGPPDDLPLARHFENMGQTFFRSGSGVNDTYAQFASGGVLEMHKHFDDNNFTIYKLGYLALDSGNRGGAGIHLSHYYARTVAHNAITIRMPGEELPRYWHHLGENEEELPVPNDGGQNERGGGSEVVAFETTNEYAYIAGDASGSYNQDKVNLVLRQFVFVPPDYFVVFDRVESDDPSYEKRWLLHTAAEPRTQGLTFSADHESGRLFCRTLYPPDAAQELVGGPDKRFWNDGRNWPLLPDYRARADTSTLVGQWRVEVRPSKPAATDYFLHLIQASGQGSVAMTPSELVDEGDGMLGVRFRLGDEGRVCTVKFAQQGQPAGHIEIRSPDGRPALARSLTKEVQPQAGLFDR